jgi:diguanylate cyclase (GGDEF)-like protein
VDLTFNPKRTAINMNSQIQSIAGSTKPVATPPGTHQNSEQQFASKVLALTSILQTTLETNELLALFSRELTRFVNFDGLTYHLESLDIHIDLGQKSRHSCDYQLIVSGEPLGDLMLYRAYPFQPSELETIENLMAGLLYPLRNALLYYRAVQSALIDPLTGVKNRSTMESAIHREMELARRHGTTLSVILMDIDHFKQINDRFGHLCGDQVLRSVAQCAEQTIRESDMLFRYGGEEFLILLTGTYREGARMLAERIRENIQQLAPHAEMKMHLTVSLGVTCIDESDDIDTLFKRADAALYQAKNNGRNQVVVD